MLLIPKRLGSDDIFPKDSGDAKCDLSHGAFLLYSFKLGEVTHCQQSPFDTLVLAKLG